eukprot:6375612-Pyramimonas_sp.AAC.1
MGLRRFLVAGEIFQAMGMPRNTLKLDQMPANSDWRELTGNMMALPCVGSLIGAILASVDFKDGVDYRARPDPVP